ncbi:MAG TPA: isoprenylcysteine carboxylmethyltransferase family protein [Blastocatellia bacterium]|nr:isoprenylcysteine carboxylmethyltransferase family protein [Blastocatellia bacterium]
MIFLRLYLLAGLIAHKALWEALKWRAAGYRAIKQERRPVSVKLIKGVKVAILLGVAAQTMSPDVWPITSSPLSLRVVGALIYTSGLAIALLGRIQLGSNWSDIEEARATRNQAVVSHGLYRYIRHPIYVGDLLLLAGLELSLNSWLALSVGFLAPVVFWRAVREERMLAAALPGYDAYCAQTKRFIPFVV